ncbi:nucleoside-diphosphate kinase [bacterium]|nr:MAG: nucleoside-diphosphate kinase [bacterium]
MEETLLIIKPDGVQRNLIGEVLRIVESNGLQILNIKMLKLSREKAEEFYSVHKGKFFFERLINFMISGPVVVVRLKGENAVNKLREIMGKTDPKEAEPGTIRRMYGLDVTRNTVHGSDTPEHAKQEIYFFFGEEAWER